MLAQKERVIRRQNQILVAADLRQQIPLTSEAFVLFSILFLKYRSIFFVHGKCIDLYFL